ncbi:MAG TPA: ATP-binding protein [Nocardioidaceae bacterium]|nr:ATP-binding protein [Nocardioidaceae bacterium]
MPAPATWSAQTQWPPEPRHVGDARRFVAEQLVATDLDHLVDTVGLIVSELATNAVRHAHSPFRVSLARAEDQLLLVVRDESSAPALLGEGDASAVGGRGLQLVSTLSHAWGVTPHAGDGKSVWARFDIVEAEMLSV